MVVCEIVEDQIQFPAHVEGSVSFCAPNEGMGGGVRLLLGTGPFIFFGLLDPTFPPGYPDHGRVGVGRNPRNTIVVTMNPVHSSI